jgi:hypothetical protein
MITQAFFWCVAIGDERTQYLIYSQLNMSRIINMFYNGFTAVKDTVTFEMWNSADVNNMRDKTWLLRQIWLTHRSIHQWMANLIRESQLLSAGLDTLKSKYLLMDYRHRVHAWNIPHYYSKCATFSLWREAKLCPLTKEPYVNESC